MGATIVNDDLDEFDPFIRRLADRDPRLSMKMLNKKLAALIVKHTRITWLGSIDIPFRVGKGGYDDVRSRVAEVYEMALEINRLTIKSKDKKTLFNIWACGWGKNKIISIGKDLAEAQRKCLGYTAEDFFELSFQQRKNILINYIEHEEFFQKKQEKVNCSPQDIVVPPVNNIRKTLENIKRVCLNPSGVTHTVSPHCGSSDGWTL